MKIGIVGCGNIGGLIAREAPDIPRFSVAALADADRRRAFELASALPDPPPVLPLRELIDAVDLVIEAACPAVVPEILAQACPLGKDVIIISIGGMLDLPDDAAAALTDTSSRIYLPSGALAGLDAVKAAMGDRVEKITLTTRKPPRGLEGAPYLERAGIDLEGIESPTVVFEGTAREAVKGFPKNINVAAALSLAGVGAAETRVRIIADPAATANSHEIEAVGDFGRIQARTENRPFPQNPKTSYLAALSVLAVLRKIAGPLQIGT